MYKKEANVFCSRILPVKAKIKNQQGNQRTNRQQKKDKDFRIKFKCFFVRNDEQVYKPKERTLERF